MVWFLRKFSLAANKILEPVQASEREALMLGKLLSAQLADRGAIASLADVEFQVFSQFGDDGIIQWLKRNIDFPNQTFVEFGVESYRESNTRFLLMNDNWTGLIMDGSEKNIHAIVHSEYYWKHQLTAKAAFIDADNVNALIGSANLGRELGILHIDIDGNDYWIWKQISVVSPVVVIMEYNSVFGLDRAITTPYDKAFYRTRASHTNLYFGASLRALHSLALERGYAFIGCNSAGNNAYFVRRDKLNDRVREIGLQEGYVESKFREGRDEHGQLTFLNGKERLEAIRGLPVFNVDTGKVEAL